MTAQEATSTAVAPDGQEPQPRDQGQEPPTGDATVPESDAPRTFDEAAMKKVRREAADYRTRLGASEERNAELLARIQALEDRGKTDEERRAEADKAKDDLIAELKHQLGDERARALRVEVFIEKGLDPRAAKFSHKTDREGIEAEAEEFRELGIGVQPKPPTAAGFDGGARATPPQKGSPDEEHNRLIIEAIRASRAGAS